MGAEADNSVVSTLPHGIPASAVREYIADMLGELCAVAEQSGEQDLHVLLKLTTQAVRNATP